MRGFPKMFPEILFLLKIHVFSIFSNRRTPRHLVVRRCFRRCSWAPLDGIDGRRPPPLGFLSPPADGAPVTERRPRPRVRFAGRMPVPLFKQALSHADTVRKCPLVTAPAAAVPLADLVRHRLAGPRVSPVSGRPPRRRRGRRRRCARRACRWPAWAASSTCHRSHHSGSLVH